jgi:hypothetical protein
MITFKDVIGIIIIMLMFTLYALFKDDPMKGLENAGKLTEKIFGGIKKLMEEIERI